MQKTVPIKPRRNLVKKAARAFLLSSNQDKLPIDVDSFFQPGKYFLFEAEKAEQLTQMKIPIDFWSNHTAEAFTCFYEGVYITIFKTVGRTSQRIRFSKAHELGHIVLNHFTEFEQPDSYSIYKSAAYQVLEREADMFAAELLAPTPILNKLSLFDVERIKRLCDISTPAADITISDMNLDLNVSEADKNSVLRRFHRYIYTKEYNKCLIEEVCPRCHSQISKGTEYCQICGCRIVHHVKGSPQEYSAPIVTQNGRLRTCLKCGTSIFRGGQTKCDECGQPLYNKCKNPEHKKLLPEFARYCPYCGEASTFYESEILLDWVNDLKRSNEANSYFEKAIDGIPLSTDWHYWIHEILILEDPILYEKLNTSVAILEDDDLLIFSNIESIPIDYIRDELKKYCDLDVVSITLEGGFEYGIK